MRWILALSFKLVARIDRPRVHDHALGLALTKTAGFRANPRGFFAAVVSGTRAAPVLEDVADIEVPKAFGTAQGLRFLEDECTRILQQHRPSAVTVREAEYGRSSSSSAMRARARVEGALLSASGREGLNAEVLLLATISSRLGVKKAKVFLEADDLRALDWSKVKGEGREAILAAVAVLA